jgi:hypothetical protein
MLPIAFCSSAGLLLSPTGLKARVHAPYRTVGAAMLSPSTHGNVHGDGGAYVGGYWVPLDECDKKFNILGGSNENVEKTPCPRSRTRHTAAKSDGSYDVCSELSFDLAALA